MKKNKKYRNISKQIGLSLTLLLFVISDSFSFLLNKAFIHKCFHLGYSYKPLSSLNPAQISADTLL